MLSQKQISDAIRHGVSDARTSCQESGEFGAPADGWDGWLVNSIGGRRTCELAGLKRAEGPDWETWLTIYHCAACQEAERLSAESAST